MSSFVKPKYTSPPPPSPTRPLCSPKTESISVSTPEDVAAKTRAEHTSEKHGNLQDLPTRSAVALKPTTASATEDTQDLHQQPHIDGAFLPEQGVLDKPLLLATKSTVHGKWTADGVGEAAQQPCQVTDVLAKLASGTVRPNRHGGKREAGHISDNLDDSPSGTVGPNMPSGEIGVAGMRGEGVEISSGREQAAPAKHDEDSTVRKKGRVEGGSRAATIQVSNIMELSTQYVAAAHDMRKDASSQQHGLISATKRSHPGHSASPMERESQKAKTNKRATDMRGERGQDLEHEQGPDKKTSSIGLTKQKSKISNQNSPAARRRKGNAGNCDAMPIKAGGVVLSDRIDSRAHEGNRDVGFGFNEKDDPYSTIVWYRTIVACLTAAS